MCIIIYKPKGKNFPKTEDLKKYWDCNPDGAGLAIQKEGKIEVIKGIMDFKDLEILLNLIETENHNIALHFRARSKGEVNPHSTHPFLLGDQPKTLWYLTQKPVLFHNGTLSQFGSENKSDSQELAEWLGKFYGKLKLNEIAEILSKIDAHDKFLLMAPEKIYLIGSWSEKDGIYYSNQFIPRFYHYYDWNFEFWKTKRREKEEGGEEWKF